MCFQTIHQNGCLCWHKRGWNDFLKRGIRLSNQRKRRKKQRCKLKNHNQDHGKILDCQTFKLHPTNAHNTLPMMIIISLEIIVLSILTSCFPPNKIVLANCQLILEHPKSRTHRAIPERQFIFSPTLAPYSLPIEERLLDRPDFIREDHFAEASLHPWKLSDYTDHSLLPIDRNNHDELARKMHPTMVLESLLRHPFSINKSPFPLLPWPSSLEDQRVKLPNRQKIYRNHAHRPYRTSSNKQVTLRPIRLRKGSKIGRIPLLDTSTTNQSTISTKSDMTNVLNNLGPLNGLNLFNSSSLNYLVDKLLSEQPSKQLNSVQAKRPIRLKSPQITNTTLDESLPQRKPFLQKELNFTKPEVTLDMLIKDEYDSRVIPMIKSLIDQQKLSTAKNLKEDSAPIDTSTKVGPINHKIDVLASGVEATTTNMGSRQNESTRSNIEEPNMNVPTTTPMSSESIATLDPEDNNTLVSFEDSDDGDEGEEDDDEALQGEIGLELDKILASKVGIKINNLTTTSKPELKKTLQNVPPYQLSGNFYMHPVRTKPPKLNIPSTGTHATTFKPVTSTVDPRIGSTTMKSVRFGEKTADASVRGPFVYSDGEPERANRMRAQSRRTSVRPSQFDSNLKNFSPRRKNQDLAPTTISDRTLQSQDDKNGDSFLLNQLFSTMNPFTDLDLKLKEQLNKKSSTKGSNNPLVYKGYVGRDDYSMSTTPKDWSRPLMGSRENTSTTPYRYHDITITSTTPAPPTDPPTVPYNYYLNQPVTNAQSVPTMVIPTGDLPEITTPLPTTIEYDRRKVTRHHLQNELSHTGQYPAQQLGNAIQNITLLPMNNSTSLSFDRKFSYQIPDKQHTANLSSIPVLTRSNSHISGESELMSKTRGGISIPKSDDIDQNWSPSKVLQNESAKSIQKRRQQSHSADGSTIVSVLNHPKIVPIVGLKSSSGTLNRSQDKVLGDNDSDVNGFTTTTPKPSQGTIISENQNHEDHSVQRNSSHGDHRTNSNKRNKVKIVHHDSNNSSTGLMGDIENDHLASSSENNGGIKRKSNRPTLNINTDKKISVPDGSDSSMDYQDESDEDSDESDEHEPPVKTKVRKIRPNADESKVENSRRDTKQNKPTKKGSHNENHELAGSEILVTGLDKNLRFSDSRKRNQTLSFANSRQPSTAIETILIDGSESSLPSTQTSGSGSSSSFGSTIIPNSNYFGDASSESTTLDNPTSTTTSAGTLGSKSTKQYTVINDDPYQRSSNTVLSTVQQPSSTTSSPIGSKQQTSTTQVNTKLLEDGSTGTAQQPTKPVSKTSNDRLAFILIGGSCALSVVCLVLAAMSMRCQDMCDDYRSLRNAERAALKLQKHRLKYTKNHQINRFNQGSRVSPEIGHSLIDDLNHQNSNSIESEINHIRNPKYLNGKSIQNNDPFLKTSDTDLGAWASKCQYPVSSHQNKDPVVCRCGNCHNHRWLCQDDMVMGNKQQSWMQPCYYVQNHSRVRPLFGVGSSVGTFFPRRLEEHTCMANGGPSDAQILIDNQPAHSCLIGDQRDMTRSKSILHTNKIPRHSENLDLPCEVPDFNCNNPDHLHHVCHNHHKYNMETATSDEGKMTLDESLHCDSAKCSGNHQGAGLNNRLKLMQVRSNGHKHHSTFWKPESMRKSSHNHHNHHHHHNQPQLSSSEGSSIAQCTCARDHQPLLSKANTRQHHRTSHKHSSFKHESRLSQQQAKRDKAMLIWSTNRDRLI